MLGEVVQLGHERLPGQRRFNRGLGGGGWRVCAWAWVRGWLQAGQRWRWSMLLLTALLVGLLLAPDLVRRNYPTDPALLGTPVIENIKAPHDIDVIDEETTERLRDEAMLHVRRVYDFDAHLGEKLGEQAKAAFAKMRRRLNVAAGVAGDTLFFEEGLVGSWVEGVERQAATAHRAEFERDLGTAVSDAEFAALLKQRFSLAVGEGLKVLLKESLADWVLAEGSLSPEDRDNGIAVQRVPQAEEGARHLVDTPADHLVDIDFLRTQFFDRAKKALPGLPPARLELVQALARRMVQPNLTLNRADTEMARAESRLTVSAVTLAVKKGEMIVRDGERLSRRQLLVLRALAGTSRQSGFALVASGAALTVLVLIWTGFRLSERRGSGGELQPRDILFLVVLFVGAVAAARVWFVVAQALHERFGHVPLMALLLLLPVAAGPMVARLVLRVEHALLFALTTSLVVGLLYSGERVFLIYAVVGSVLGSTVLGTMTARSDLLRAGFWVGLGQVCTALGMQLFEANAQWSDYVLTLPVAFVGGILSASLALAVTPAVEAIFGYTTDLKLLELANLNHPALKELIVQAPGSYHHSVVVGSLVEAAAEATGANALLARVMAYYHDVGKGVNPGYFIENQRSGQNPHDKLKPSMSAMIIRRHVTDGIELARRYGLGSRIIAGIAEHHGTTLMHYFFHRAQEQAQEGAVVAESDYRYGGPKPQTREAALVMLADAVEAAARSLSDPTPARLRGLINRIINMKFVDGQLEECDLTLRDLHTIAKSFARVLNSIYHQRLEYPELLKNLGAAGKRHHGDLDPKLSKKVDAQDSLVEEVGSEDLRRLGLS